MRAWMFGATMGLLLAAAGAAQAAVGYHVVARIAGPDGGWDYVRVNPHTRQVLVTRGGSVMAVDLADGHVTAGLAPGLREHVALPVNGGTELLVTNGGTDTAVFVDATTGAALATVATGKGPDAATVDPRSGLVLVMAHAGGEVTLVEPKARRAVGNIAIGGALEEAVADGAGRAFVNVEDRNEIAVLDLARRKLSARWPLPGCDGPTGLAYDPQDRLLIAACDGSTALVRTDTGRVIQTLPTGKGADGAAYDARRRLAFVPAGRDGTLAVIGFARGTGRILEKVPTQKGARTLAVDEKTGWLYLPSAEYAPATGGGRPTPIPGTFHVLVVAP